MYMYMYSFIIVSDFRMCVGVEKHIHVHDCTNFIGVGTCVLMLWTVFSVVAVVFCGVAIHTLNFRGCFA